MHGVMATHQKGILKLMGKNQAGMDLFAAVFRGGLAATNQSFLKSCTMRQVAEKGIRLIQALNLRVQVLLQSPAGTRYFRQGTYRYLSC